MKYDEEKKKITVTYIPEVGWKDVKRLIEDECVQASFITLAADFDESRLQPIVAELTSEFDL